MSKTLLFATAAALILGLSACDEQQASESSPAPMQQQGAAPPVAASPAAPTTPAMEPTPSDPTVAPAESTQ